MAAMSSATECSVCAARVPSSDMPAHRLICFPGLSVSAGQLNKGKCLFTTMPFSAGSEMLAEEALISSAPIEFGALTKLLSRLPEAKCREIFELVDVHSGCDVTYEEAKLCFADVERGAPFTSAESTRMGLTSMNFGGILRTNSMPQDGDVHGLYAVCCRANHSCSENASCQWSAARERQVLVAKRDIEKGEEVTVNYIQGYEGEDLEERRARLRDGFHFECDCERCGADNEPG